MVGADRRAARCRSLGAGWPSVAGAELGGSNTATAVRIARRRGRGQTRVWPASAVGVALHRCGRPSGFAAAPFLPSSAPQGPLPPGFPSGGARGSARRLFRGCGHAVRRLGWCPAARLRHAPAHPPERPSGLRRPPHPSPERPPQSPLPPPSGTSRSASQRLEPPKSLFFICRLYRLSINELSILRLRSE